MPRSESVTDEVTALDTGPSSDWEVRNETAEDLTLVVCEPTSSAVGDLKSGASVKWTAPSTIFTYQGSRGYISGTAHGSAMSVASDPGYVVETEGTRVTIRVPGRTISAAPGGTSTIALDDSGAGGASPSPPAPTKSDDDAVSQWIRWGLAKGTAQDPKADLATQRQNAHAALMAERDGRCDDLALACAEHYMFARYVVALKGLSGWAIIAGSTYVYQGVKVVAWMFGSLDRLKSGKCPVTSPSYAEWAWAAGGAKAGLRDYKAAQNGQP